MTKLFGLDMAIIMGVLLAIVGVALVAFIYAALRNPTLFKLGLRNIPRRRAQTIVIVFGLMVSTLIITAAFTTGDSLSYSITNTVYQKSGPVDLQVEPRAAAGDATAGAPYISAAALAAFTQQLDGKANVTAVLPVIDEPVPAANPASRLVEPRVHLLGLDPRAVAAVGGLATQRGGGVQISDLQPGQAYLNASAADKLDAQAGSSIVLTFNNQQFPLTVKAVVADRRLSGWQGEQRDDNGGIVASLATVRTITGRADGVNGIWLSTGADSHMGYTRGNALFPAARAAAASDSVKAQLDGSGVTLKAHNSKHDAVDDAVKLGNIATTFFLSIGLFSIAAGMMLIFLIFVMLAAERRTEMGMARAVGIKRMGLVQSFLAEGMVYNLLAGVVGLAAGVAVAFGLVWFVANVVFTGKYALSLTSHVSATSLIVSYCLGVALTFITVVVSAVRTTRMNIVAAIRDIPEDGAPAAGKRRFSWKLLGSSLARLAGSVAVLAVLANGAKMGVAAPIVFVAGVALLVVAALVVTRSVWGVTWRTLAAIPAGATWGILGASRAFGWSWAAIWSRYFILLGALAVVASHGASSIALFMLGSSLLLLGLALAARVRGVSTRIAFTVMSAAMIGFWLMPAATFKSLFGGIYGHDNGGIEMFFLSGMMLVLSTTLLLIYNAELLARLVNRLGGVFGSLRPSLATAIAYPMASRLRTGMTLAMFSLIIFSVTVMTTLNTNFDRMLLTDDATGGWDVTAATNLNNPIPDLRATLAQAGVDAGKITASGATTPYEALTDVRNAGDNVWQRYNVRAANADFLAAATGKIQAHVKGTAAADAWKTLQSQPGTALIDALALQAQNGSGDDVPTFQLKGAKQNTTLLNQPLIVEVRDAAGNVHPLKVIGVINQIVGNTQFTLFTSGQTFSETLGVQPEYTQYALRLAKGTDDKVYAKQIKANLGGLGVQAASVRSDLHDQQTQNRGFSYLVQGFMALGLVVGVAAIAVIAARTVVERRQQIGMLRAVGYRRSQVALSFALETSFIALFGIAAGVVTAAILSYNLFAGGTFGDTSSTGFSLPYLQIAVFVGAAYVASLLMTYLPSRKAASLPIAEALRYE